MELAKKNNITKINGVDLFRWAPNQPIPHLRPYRLFYWTRKLPFSPILLNFGDLLSEDIVRFLAPTTPQKKLSQ